jgi:hypothetical protein
MRKLRWVKRMRLVRRVWRMKEVEVGLEDKGRYEVRG